MQSLHHQRRLVTGPLTLSALAVVSVAGAGSGVIDRRVVPTEGEW